MRLSDLNAPAASKGLQISSSGGDLVLHPAGSLAIDENIQLRVAYPVRGSVAAVQSHRQKAIKAICQYLKIEYIPPQLGRPLGDAKEKISIRLVTSQ